MATCTVVLLNSAQTAPTAPTSPTTDSMVLGQIDADGRSKPMTGLPTVWNPVTALP